MPDRSPDPRRERGRAGERIAAEYLARRGFRLVDANWRTRFGELDLIGWDGPTLVFVEVRSRRGLELGTAAESVDAAKQRQLRLMAEQYLERHAPQAEARIDVVTVLFGAGAPQVEHLVGAV
jgi:putative endonuclease